ncbi:helix-turn-helix domain-containing protein [Comamonas suwonensis]|uniref:Helix-turn-helix domain-containing protein n=1 Tax=Comamonas suwonensis TaxID=2606214 RepID=A0A843BGB8_9BURK|nr:helix-turn-helix domain-containing protein [Comamonas suwonensis]MBI1626458.1 helix-turn-helix domain-containing protein [Comamonas suwonensis]
MSTIIMSACWPMQGMSAAQKAVLISLADQANDDGYCWPSVKTITMRTCLSARAVQGAIRWLESSGILRSSERRGTSTVYQLTPAAYAPPQQMHPAPAAPRGAPAAPPPPQELHPTPAAAAPKPSMNHQLNRKEPEDKRVAAPTFAVPDWINRAHWDAWHSCAKRKKATDAQKQMAVDKLDAWRHEGVDHAAALENAAIAGWQGLFKPDMAPEAGRRSGGRQPANTYKHAGAAAAIFDGVWE